MRTWPKKTSAASMNAVAIWMYCEPSSSAAPIVAIGDHAADEREQQDRQLPEEIVEPEEKRGFVQIEDEPACATFCIHVPTVEVNAPNQRTRKSR